VVVVTPPCSFTPPPGAAIIDLPADVALRPKPVYRTPRGKIATISGDWCYPREFYSSDGALFVEVPSPRDHGWGVTFHAVRRPRTPIGTFCRQYSEGRSSGFPMWPVVYYAARAAACHLRFWFRGVVT
jgi:hypothetical protein